VSVRLLALFITNLSYECEKSFPLLFVHLLQERSHETKGVVYNVFNARLVADVRGF
jgi:hypothetical protein